VTKAQVRAELLARRREMTAQERSEAADAIALHTMTVPVIAQARRVACYLSMLSEPGTGPLIEQLLARGTEVIVPVTLPNRTLDWVSLDSDADPWGYRLGHDALYSCSAVIAPALAVDHAGHRLGRGAGYYDRALVSVRAPVCALVFTDELLSFVPHEPLDIPVQMAVTPGGLFRVPPARSTRAARPGRAGSNS